MYVFKLQIPVVHRIGMLYILAKLRLGGEAEEAGSELFRSSFSSDCVALAAFAVREAGDGRRGSSSPSRVPAASEEVMKQPESLVKAKLCELNGASSGNELSAKNKRLCFLKSFIFDKCLSLAFV